MKSKHKHEIVYALLARLYRAQKNVLQSLNMYEKITQPYLYLHPQIVIEYNLTAKLRMNELLTNSTESTAKAVNDIMKHRGMWLSRVSSLTDEYLVECRVEYLIDSESYQQALDLLLSTKFHFIHQRYVRTNLYRKCCDALKIEFNINVIDSCLREDRLAQFGAYADHAQTN